MAVSEQSLTDAKRLRDAARGIVRTDIATLRHSLADRPIKARFRDGVVDGATQTVASGIELADENRLVVGVTLAAVAGWLFRNPLGRAAQTSFVHARRAIARWRA